jgi:hypothetical protein
MIVSDAAHTNFAKIHSLNQSVIRNIVSPIWVFLNVDTALAPGPGEIAANADAFALIVADLVVVQPVDGELPSRAAGHVYSTAVRSPFVYTSYIPCARVSVW